MRPPQLRNTGASQTRLRELSDSYKRLSGLTRPPGALRAATPHDGSPDGRPEFPVWGQTPQRAGLADELSVSQLLNQTLPLQPAHVLALRHNPRVRFPTAVQVAAVTPIEHEIEETFIQTLAANFR